MMEDFQPALSHNNWLRNSESIRVKAEVRPYSIKELCSLYQLSYRMLKTLLEPIEDKIGKKEGKVYSVLQVEKIFMHIGIPYEVISGKR